MKTLIDVFIDVFMILRLIRIDAHGNVMTFLLPQRVSEQSLFDTCVQVIVLSE